MSNWLTGQELLERWQIKAFQLFDHVKNNLQPYDQLGQPKPPPDVYAKLQKLKRLEDKLEMANIPQIVWVDYEWQDGGYEKEVIPREEENYIYDQIEDEVNSLKSELKDAPTCWHYYELPEREEDCIPIFDELKKSFFRIKDIEKYEKTNKINVIRGSSIMQDDSFLADMPSYRGAFVLRGESWEITFDGITKLLKHRECIYYVVQLLKYPNQKIHVLDLVRFVKGNSADDLLEQNVNMKKTEEEENDYSQEDSFDYNELHFFKQNVNVDKLDKNDIDKIREIGNKLLKELESARKSKDTKKIKEITKKLEYYKEYVRKEYGYLVRQKGTQVFLTNKYSAKNPEVEKARKLVYKHIVNAKKHIGEIMPKLKTYLDNHITTGANCKFKSNEPDWKINP
ncbi:MAG TPA: hypothetical protein PLH43_12070 [Acetivibrio sp.]|uniref:hypothetical protein n=1 Tax=Acetivibrio sp. TaxID=1872092 RepID=UPI002CA16506|nr:hypothetical protein [Acetivibrio sp.]HOM03542.1 hypothetical protein [Acetivibrio sp.]HOT42503.1 hypothetical protein [Syntrophorhabdaceae bacterium]HQH43812.1 hypothetical protein [Syntrophorhabdaceae bacterium]